MQESDQIRLTHMLEASQEALSFIQGKARQDLSNDRKLVLALIKLIEIVGEASMKVSHECKNATPDIPWAQIAGMRHRLIHAYFDVKLALCGLQSKTNCRRWSLS